MFQRLIMVADHFEHKPEADVNFIRALEVRVYVEQLLKCLDRPGMKEEEVLFTFWLTLTAISTTQKTLSQPSQPIFGPLTEC